MTKKEMLDILYDANQMLAYDDDTRLDDLLANVDQTRDLLVRAIKKAEGK